MLALECETHRNKKARQEREAGMLYDKGCRWGGRAGEEKSIRPCFEHPDFPTKYQNPIFEIIISTGILLYDFQIFKSL